MNCRYTGGMEFIMKLGFVSAILDTYTFEEMIDTASEMGFECVEVACWPQGKAETLRRCFPHQRRRHKRRVHRVR